MIIVHRFDDKRTAVCLTRAQEQGQKECFMIRTVPVRDSWYSRRTNGVFFPPIQDQSEPATTSNTNVLNMAPAVALRDSKNRFLGSPLPFASGHTLALGSPYLCNLSTFIDVAIGIPCQIYTIVARRSIGLLF